MVESIDQTINGSIANGVEVPMDIPIENIPVENVPIDTGTPVSNPVNGFGEVPDFSVGISFQNPLGKAAPIMLAFVLGTALGVGCVIGYQKIKADKKKGE